jgi:hypothetical protein
VDRVDPEPDEPWLTLPEVLIIGGLIAFATGFFVLSRCERAMADLKRWFDEMCGGL